MQLLIILNVQELKLFSFQFLAGVFLPKLCESQEQNPRRAMSEMRSSGYVAPAPVKPVEFMMVAPAQAPY